MPTSIGIPLIRPLAGRLHCGIAAAAVLVRTPSSSDRSPVGSIAAGRRTGLRRRRSPHPTARRSAPLRLGHVPVVIHVPRAHPTARRSAPLRLDHRDVVHVPRRDSSDRSPVGSIAASSPGLLPTPVVTSSDRSPVGSIAASRASSARSCYRSLIRPLAGRLHCGTRCGSERHRCGTSSDRSPVGSIAAPQASWRKRSSRASSDRSPVGSIAACCPNASATRTGPLIRPLAGRLHCGKDFLRTLVQGRCSSDRSPVGSIAARCPYRRRDCTGGLIRPLAGRLHCGGIPGAPVVDMARLLILPLAGRLHCGVILLALLGLVFLLIRPLAGRLHCGHTWPGR